MENCNQTLKSVEDVFGNGEPFNKDHIWPKSLGGTNAEKNKLVFSVKTNTEKANKTKGSINGIKFSIIKQTTKENENREQTVYGVMHVEFDDVCYTISK